MTLQQWVNAGPDEGAVHALLGRVAQQLPIATIDEVWVFPTRRTSEGESTVIVAAAFDANDERRRVFTFRFVVTRDRRGAATVREHADEFGSAPSHAIARVIEGVLRRLGDDAEVPPKGRAIGGEAERWREWVVELGAGEGTRAGAGEGTHAQAGAGAGEGTHAQAGAGSVGRAVAGEG
jgi:hypothetical protein